MDVALEPESAERILALVIRLVRQGHASVLASLASLALASKLGDRLIVLDEGLLTFDGPPRRLIERSLF